MRTSKKRLLFLRILLGTLIVCNMFMILWFSSHNGDKSSLVSNRFAANVIGLLPKNFVDKIVNGTNKVPEVTQPQAPTEPSTGEVEGTVPAPPEVTEPEETHPEESLPTPPEQTKPEIDEEQHAQNQAALMQKWYFPIRKFAHMVEFGSLGALVLLFLLTWHGKLLWRYGASIGFSFIYALCDEANQLSRVGRQASLLDIFIDLLGAFIACTLLLAIVFARRNRGKMITTHYSLPITPNGTPISIALVADLHACPHENLVARLRAEKPDVILIAGDLMENVELGDSGASGYAFLRACAEIAPTYYSLGNHETVGAGKKKTLDEHLIAKDIRARVAKTGAVLLHNESVLWNGIRICGLTSGLSKKENIPCKEALSAFATAPEFRILLCHHPEYYMPYIRQTDIELTVCGHAHGGQWRFFGRGVFAPGQGLFPKYTSGVVDGRCVISRGAGDHTFIPRIANPRELVIIRLFKENK